LSFGKQSVESQTRLPAATQTRDNHKLPLRYRHIYILQVVRPCSFDKNIHFSIFKNYYFSIFISTIRLLLPSSVSITTSLFPLFAADTS
jgi:hypothetical protein